MTITLAEPAPPIDPEQKAGRARDAIVRHGVTTLILFGPLAGAVIGSVMLLRGEVTLVGVAVAIALYAITGHALTVGYHRMCTHRALKATRATKIALIMAGSLGFEGGVLGWVANHRQHHAFTDVEGDPHSPHLAGSTIQGQIRGAFHAHVGWLFAKPVEDAERWIPDLLEDRDLVLIDRLFPLFCVISLAIPTLIAWSITQTMGGAISGLIWGGLVRVFILQHATFAVNSACHLWGKQPFATPETDQARNCAPLALLSMGDNWHNLHHALPRLARHGVFPHQWDSTARVIWLLEKAKLVHDVRWPDEELLALHHRACNSESEPVSLMASE